METGHDPIVMQAIANVQSRHGAEQWAILEPRQAAQQIYAEIRRLDLDAHPGKSG